MKEIVKDYINRVTSWNDTDNIPPHEAIELSDPFFKEKLLSEIGIYQRIYSVLQSENFPIYDQEKKFFYHTIQKEDITDEEWEETKKAYKLLLRKRKGESVSEIESTASESTASEYDNNQKTQVTNTVDNLINSDNGSEKNTIAGILKVIATIIFVSGFLIGLIIAFYMKKIGLIVAVAAWIIAFIIGLIILVFEEILRLLQRIEWELQQQRNFFQRKF